MKIKINSAVTALILVVIVLFAANLTWAQKDSTRKQRLKSPAVVKGEIGGEAHDSYVIRARKGQTMTVRISWRHKDNNRAEFSISRSANFFEGEPVKFGKESNVGKTWRGKIPRTGDYYIYVVAHPTADYTISVTLQ